MHLQPLQEFIRFLVLYFFRIRRGRQSFVVVLFVFINAFVFAVAVRLLLSPAVPTLHHPGRADRQELLTTARLKWVFFFVYLVVNAIQVCFELRRRSCKPGVVHDLPQFVVALQLRS